MRHYDFTETGYLEGWGEYASQLCWDMGVYTTPYDKAGRIMQDLMVSTRLVVDTGMNALGWSRERAMQYMRENLTITTRKSKASRCATRRTSPAKPWPIRPANSRCSQSARTRAKNSAPNTTSAPSTRGSSTAASMTLDTLREHVDYEIKNS